MAFYRTLHDTSHMLLDSFCEDDLMRIARLSDSNDSENSIRVRRIFADVSVFFEGVCKDLLVLFPQCTKHQEHFTTLFSRTLGSKILE